MPSLYIASSQPDEQEVAEAERALHHVRDYLDRHDASPIQLTVKDEPDALEVPRSAVELLSAVLAHMAAGQGVSIVPNHAELTTQQAADLMNVSRPFLIGLLDAGEIDYRTVGKHRRIRADALMTYIADDDRRRREAADELTQLAQEMGLT